MKLPRKLNIFGQLVKVEKVPLDDGIGGLCYSRGLIQINDKLPKNKIPQVVSRSNITLLY